MSMMLQNLIRNQLKEHMETPEAREHRKRKPWTFKDHIVSTNDEPVFASFLILYSAADGRDEFNAVKRAIQMAFPNATVYGKPTEPTTKGAAPMLTLKHAQSGRVLWSGEQWRLSYWNPSERMACQARITEACKTMLKRKPGW